MRRTLPVFALGALTGALMLWLALPAPSPSRVFSDASVTPRSAPVQARSDAQVELLQRRAARQAELDEQELEDAELDELDEPQRDEPGSAAIAVAPPEDASIEDLAAQIVGTEDGDERKALIRAYQARTAEMPPEAIAAALAGPAGKPGG